MTLQNEKFEELLARQLNAELEPQRGKAAAAFQAQVAAEAAQRAAAQRAARQAAEAGGVAGGVAGGSKHRESWARREVSGRALWLWTGVPSLIAAALAVVVTLHFADRTRSTLPIVPENPMANNAPVAPLKGGSGGAGVGNGALAAHLDISQNPPSGVVIVNNPLFHEIQPQSYQPSQWVDPVDHAYHLAEPPPPNTAPPPAQP